MKWKCKYKFVLKLLTFIHVGFRLIASKYDSGIQSTTLGYKVWSEIKPARYKVWSEIRPDPVKVWSEIKTSPVQSLAMFDIEKYEIYVGGLLWHPKDALQLLDIWLKPIGIASGSDWNCIEIQNGGKSPSLILKNMRIYGWSAKAWNGEVRFKIWIDSDGK